MNIPAPCTPGASVDDARPGHNDGDLHDTQNTSGLIVTNHFATRQAQRARTPVTVALALRYGRQFHDGPYRIHFLGRRDIPLTVEPNLAARAEGTVVVRRDNVLVTTFRNPRFLRTLKRRDRFGRRGW